MQNEEILEQVVISVKHSVRIMQIAYNIPLEGYFRNKKSAEKF